MKRKIMLCTAVLMLAVSIFAVAKSAVVVSSEGVLWGYDDTVYLVGLDDDMRKKNFNDEFYDVTDGMTLIGLSEAEEKKEHEIVFGQTGRDISQKAYAALDDMLQSHADVGYDTEAYLLYVEDGSLAFAYTGENAMANSIEDFFKECNVKELSDESGIILSSVYSLYERAERERAELYDARLAAIREKLSGLDNCDEIVLGIEKLYSLYDTDTLIWLANLYDSENGGFYYSNSARDNFGYFPDLESTAQAFNMLDRSGLYREFGGLSALGIPDFMHDSILNWARGLQSSTDGYFYHPQWGTAVASSRRGRDLDNAYSLFGYLGALPYYNDPSGRLKGILGKPGENAQKPVSALTAPLDSSAAQAVSVISTADSVLPTYLQSMDAWKTYIEKLGVSSNSYSAGNALVSEWSLIKKAGKDYVKYLINYLNEKQIPEIGLWEYQNEDDYDNSDGVGYNGTNGLMKLCILYSSLGYAVPNAYTALQSTIKVGLYPNTDPKDETVCYVLNIWTCINSMLDNVNSKDKTNYAAAKALVYENAPSLLASSYDLLKTHVMEGGGFSYFEAQPMNISQGALVGCAEGPESDINATMVATSSTVAAMFSALRISGYRIPIWCEEDYYVFMKEFDSLSPIVKNPKYGFETFDERGEPEFIEIHLNNAICSSEIVRNEDSHKGGNVLSIDATAQGKMGFVTYDSRYGDEDWRATFFEFDFLVEDAQVGELMKISFTGDHGNKIISAMSIECYVEGGEKMLRLVDTYAGHNGEAKVRVERISLGEWHRIRLMNYRRNATVNGENKLDPRTRILLDDRYVCTSDSNLVDDGYVAGDKITSCRIELYSQGMTQVYLDNILAEKKDLPYI